MTEDTGINCRPMIVTPVVRMPDNNPRHPPPTMLVIEPKSMFLGTSLFAVPRITIRKIKKSDSSDKPQAPGVANVPESRKQCAVGSQRENASAPATMTATKCTNELNSPCTNPHQYTIRPRKNKRRMLAIIVKSESWNVESQFEILWVFGSLGIFPSSRDGSGALRFGLAQSTHGFLNTGGPIDDAHQCGFLEPQHLFLAQ